MSSPLGESTLQQVRGIADGFAADRHDRQRRNELDPRDFQQLVDAGFLLTGVPATAGGLFESVSRSTRPVAEILRALAHGDSSVALVSSMHPAVLSLWLATAAVTSEHQSAWTEQRALLADLAKTHWFGTITSEPGSGGDVSQTRAVARPDSDGTWLLSGAKHFGSGSGITSFMLTTARAADEDAPDWFFADVRGAQWDGSSGITLTAPWDGHGMAATQSHGFEFRDFPVARVAWPGNWRALADAAGPFIGSLFTAVILGIVESAMATASTQLGARADSMRPYERVEWSNAEQEAWLVEQAYEGMLRAVETGVNPLRTVLLGKTAAAGLAEDCLRRLTRIMGGGTFARHSPFGFWFEDVRALGFLRPPWALAYDALHASSFTASASYFGR
jgi:alkylation response protein AidB-like acyl-CoA dehydrogenase